MAEINTPRLMAAAKEFNIGTNTLIDFLVSKDFSSDDLKPSTKLTEEMYRVLQVEFQPDKVAKQKAEQIDLPKNTPSENKKRKDEQDLSFNKKEPAKPVKEEKPVEEKAEEMIEPVISEKESEIPQKDAPEVAEIKVENDTEKAETVPIEPAPVAEIEKIEIPEVEGLKIVDKIDLSLIDSSVRPKKDSKKKEAKGKVKGVISKEEPPIETEEAPKGPVAEPEKEVPVISNIKAVKLEGPKIMGKIDLPVNTETRPKPDERRKRKRIIVDKKPTNHPPRPGGPSRPPHSDNRPQGGRFNRNAPPRREEKEIDEKEIQDKIKETQAKLAGSGGRGKSLKAKYRKQKREEAAETVGEESTENKLQVTEFISVSEFANLMDVSFADVISKCMSLGIMVSINQRLEADVIELVASEFNYEVEFIDVDTHNEIDEEEEEENEEDLVPRAPIVTIMGHVDHGKTSLLDYIRHANVIAGEAGGITQHIGAYEVQVKNGRTITFLDTPGHEAFTAMRARGAKVTDIAVIVIAADDAVMPQTKEAISHAQAADVPMVFALNKMDKEGANPEKIKEQLAAMNILVEDWGGKYQSQEISAKKGVNVDELLDKVLLESDLLELKANPKRPASGSVIEASLDKGRGYVATILVQNGTLNQGDLLVSGQHYGRIKAMFNERNQRISSAPPSTPVLVLGLNGAPQAGETFKVFEDESEAKDTANRRAQILREQGIRAKKHITLDEIGRRLALGNFKQLNLLIRADVDGSVEALSDSLQKLSTEEIAVSIVHQGVGQITETDVMLATASDAVIIGFNVRPSLQASKIAEHEGVEIKTYSIIYDAIDEVKSAMEGMLEPKIQEKVLGIAEVKETYKFDKATVAGCMVVEGKIARNNRVRLVRDGIIIHNGELGSLKRFKDDVKEVNNNMECGLTLRNYNDLKAGDMVEAFEEIEIKRTL
ncbi:translation initiation factor IF-2 [Hanamia caeni]|jgi:translation initiation factor IF-2|uniref:Translation initiation factor IF-2 n=1 Tax=Hanamia caeni TaxID=2294116 RepID=A0A3M9NLS1_9BACT|nr:translation initiation factor IF-2 [Hanamia caeni]RNI38736.1 translation initiation factor IF-2 [Hanamia caeni]